VTDPSSGGLWPLGLVFLAFYSAVALVGAVLGAGARQWGARSMKSREPDKD
jgi:hypothetical protein